MKNINLKKAGENVFKQFPSSQKNNEKNSISILSNSSYLYSINKTSKIVKKRNYINDIIGK